MIEKTEISKKITKNINTNTDKTAAEDKKAVTESDTEIEKKINKQS